MLGKPATNRQRPPRQEWVCLVCFVEAERPRWLHASEPEGEWEWRRPEKTQARSYGLAGHCKGPVLFSLL